MIMCNGKSYHDYSTLYLSPRPLDCKCIFSSINHNKVRLFIMIGKVQTNISLCRSISYTYKVQKTLNNKLQNVIQMIITWLLRIDRGLNAFLLSTMKLTFSTLT